MIEKIPTATKTSSTVIPLLLQKKEWHTGVGCFLLPKDKKKVLLESNFPKLGMEKLFTKTRDLKSVSYKLLK
ncbi:MAG: hypothetical protein OXM55_00615 [Bdellovibrionales bacterium]|nr:hypothetical protein [Bdellovibrionales bacterium]